MPLTFATDYSAIIAAIDRVDPIAYGQTRNYVDGAVTYLSPYISRGVISTKLVLERVLVKGYAVEELTSFVKELCWRDYFQRVAQAKDVNVPIRQPQQPVRHCEIPVAITEANTGIAGVDDAILQLYSSGYMHNHCRMYTAAITCNIAQSDWRAAAQWMYYHLLDGDWASNACSWQWVAGANSNKKYYANQENINKYTHKQQSHSFLDCSYTSLAQMEIPSLLLPTQPVELTTILPTSVPLAVDVLLPTFIYNYYNLDPLWHATAQGNRILLIDPEFFARFPISNKCMDFMLALGKNIPGLQVFVGSFTDLCRQYSLGEVYFKEHTLNIGYKGNEESRDWIAPAVEGYYPSFFAYWKKVEKTFQPKKATT